VKRELEKLYYLNREIEQDNRRLNELKAIATGGAVRITGLPHIKNFGRSDEDIRNEAVMLADAIKLKKRAAWSEYSRMVRWIGNVPNPQMRMILSLRHVNGMSWQQVAMSVGGGNTKDSVRKAHDRFLKSK